jgi:hypothetical protein
MINETDDILVPLKSFKRQAFDVRTHMFTNKLALPGEVTLAFTASLLDLGLHTSVTTTLSIRIPSEIETID